MALIKTVNEIKEVLPKLVTNLNSNSMLWNFDAAEEKYLTPLTGDALYADLQSKYDAATLSADELKLVKHIRLVIASYALMDEQAASHVFFTDQGIRVNGTGNLQKAVGWEYKELKNYLKDRAFDGIEVLLKYMWKNKEDLPLWTESKEYRQFADLFIRTGSDFDDHYRLNQPMRTFYLIKNYVRDTQEDFLISGFGKDLINYLAAVEDPEGDEEELIDQLKKGLAFLTIKLCCEHCSVTFGESGFTVVNQIMGGDREGDDSGRSGATVASIKIKMKACDRDGKNFLAYAKRLAVKFRSSGNSCEDFNEAFDAGKLKNYTDPKDKTSGNEKRKIFRF